MVSKQFTFAIKTMGCKANIYDSLILERELMELGGTPINANAPTAVPDIYLVNSCTVTAEADRQSVREVSQMKKKSPATVTVMTGCSAQVTPELLEKNPNIDLVIPNDRKAMLRKSIADKLGIAINDIAQDSDVFWGQLPAHQGKTRAFLKIQEGCNDYCTYCIIPYARGKSRSVSVQQVLAEIQRLTDGGVREIVLTGTNIGDYGKEHGQQIDDLIDAILTKTSLPRLRLTSLDPSEISDRILEMMKGESSRLMPHFHVSLQSPVSRVLRAMKRDYRTEEVVSALNRIYSASPDIFVGMDIIAGFPSETDHEQSEALAILRDLPWTRLHVFPYSERTGTPATRIAQSVPIPTRKARAAELMLLSKQRHEEFAKKHIGQTVGEILFETWHRSEEGYFAVGHSRNYLRVLAALDTKEESIAAQYKNRIAAAKILRAAPKPTQDWTLEAELLAL